MLHTKYKSSGPHGFREEYVLCFSYCKSLGAYDPRSVDNLDPRGMIGRIYVGYNYTLLHTKFAGFRPCGFSEEDIFIFFFHYKSMVDNDAPGHGQFGPQGHGWQDL